jgi:general secretion pathway protein I
VNKRGFTLLEVMVASLIMAIAVTGLLSALSTSLRNGARLTDYDRAVILARQKMDELILSTNVPPMIPVEGGWPPEMTGGTPTGFRAVITPFEVPPRARPGTTILERVQLEVWWMSGENRKTFSLEGFRQSPMAPGEGGLE